MPVSDGAVRDSVVAISRVEGVAMDPRALAEDAVALARALPDERDYRAAVASTCRALDQLAHGLVQSSALKYEHEGWLSYHYQHAVAQGARADMRIMYRMDGEVVVVRGFGHRDTPEDFYARMSSLRAGRRP